MINPLIGRLLLFDALRMYFRELRLRKNPECPVCGEHPTIHGLIDYNPHLGDLVNRASPGEVCAHLERMLDDPPPYLARLRGALAPAVEYLANPGDPETGIYQKSIEALRSAGIRARSR